MTTIDEYGTEDLEEVKQNYERVISEKIWILKLWAEPELVDSL
jgi:hypothetical protein